MDIDSCRYKYQELKRRLLEQIHDGAFGDDGRIDSEPALADAFGLSRNTVRQAIKELENEGYLYRVRGKGTFVRDAAPAHSRKIALLLYDTAYMAHPVTSGLIRGIDTVLGRRGYMLDILASRRGFHEENLGRLAGRYAGFLVGAWQLDALTLEEIRSLSIPHFFVKNYPPGDPSRALLVDYRRAGFLAARHLARSGRRELALVYPGDAMAIAADFKEGVRDAALEYGARLRRDHVFLAGFSDRDAAPGLAARLRSLSDRPDGIVCASDDLAVALVDALAAAGVAVPGDVAVTGCNDTDIAARATPALTTVAIPTEKLGRRAAAMMLRMIRGGRFAAERLEPRLVIRASAP